MRHGFYNPRGCIVLNEPTHKMVTWHRINLRLCWKKVTYFMVECESLGKIILSVSRSYPYHKGYAPKSHKNNAQAATGQAGVRCNEYLSCKSLPSRRRIMDSYVSSCLSSTIMFDVSDMKIIQEVLHSESVGW